MEKTVTFHIEGMMCNIACPLKLLNSVSEIEGIINCNVDYKSKIATVIFDSKKITSKEISEIISEKTYYKVFELKEKSLSLFNWLFGDVNY